MIACDTQPCELLAWDSEFFGVRIARVKGNRLECSDAARVDEWAITNRIDCLYLLAAADEPKTSRTAEQHGYHLVDIRMTLSRPMSTGLAQEPIATSVRSARPEDIPALQSMARALHRDTRFFNDPGFPAQKCEEFYSSWISLECHGRAAQVLVAAGPNEQPQGYVSCHLAEDKQIGQIGLVGVDSRFQGRGIGKTMILAALDWFNAKGAVEVLVVTQGRNIGAQYLYQRCGFATRQVQLWYHKWFSGPHRHSGFVN